LNLSALEIWSEVKSGTGLHLERGHIWRGGSGCDLKGCEPACKLVQCCSQMVRRVDGGVPFVGLQEERDPSGYRNRGFTSSPKREAK